MKGKVTWIGEVLAATLGVSSCPLCAWRTLAPHHVTSETSPTPILRFHSRVSHCPCPRHEFWQIASWQCKSVSSCPFRAMFSRFGQGLTAELPTQHCLERFTARLLAKNRPTLVLQGMDSRLCPISTQDIRTDGWLRTPDVTVLGTTTNMANQTMHLPFSHESLSLPLGAGKAQRLP